MLESMGISVEFSHHEGGPGQQEIDLRYADALTTADNIMTFRTVVREVALSQGIWATFMPKPFTSHPGSGMHTHVALRGRPERLLRGRRGVPAVQDRPAFIAGLLAHAPEISAVTNQWVNCYKRLMFGGEAPSYVCWGHNNRSAMVRVPMYKPLKGQSTRIELRTRRRGVQPLPRVRGHARRRHEGHRAGTRPAPRGRGRRVVAHRARSAPASASRRCPRASTRRSRSPSAPSCWPRPSASTSSTSSSATSAPSGTSTAARSPPSSATACFRSSRQAADRDDRLQPGPGQPAAHGAGHRGRDRGAHRGPCGVHPGERRQPRRRRAGDGGGRAAARGRGLRVQAARATPGALPRSPPS